MKPTQHSTSPITACILLIVLLVACIPASQQPTGLPQPSQAPALPTTVVTAAPTKQLEPTPVIPAARGTALPPIFETISVSSAFSMTLLAEWKVSYQPLPTLFFSPDSSLLVRDDQVWRVMDGADIENESAEALAQSQKFNFLTPISSDGRLSVDVDEWGLKIQRRAKPGELYYDLRGISKAYFMPDNLYLMVVFQDGHVWLVALKSIEHDLLDLDRGATLYEYDLAPYLDFNINAVGQTSKVLITPDHSMLVFLMQDKSIHFFRISDLSHVVTITSTSQPQELAINSNATLLATSAGKLIQLWDIKTGKKLLEINEHKQSIRAMAFSPNGRLFASLVDGWVYIWGIAPRLPYAAAHATITALAASSPTPAAIQPVFPQPTPMPTNSIPLYAEDLPLAWPVQMPSPDQINEVKNCDLDSLAAARYPASLMYWEIPFTYTPENACDLAVLALAYLQHEPNSRIISDNGKKAFIQTLLHNPAFAFHKKLIYPYYSSFELVKAPPFTQQPIQSVVLDYQWWGMGDPSNVAYHIEIRQANLMQEKVSAAIRQQQGETITQFTREISTTLVQSFSTALTDLLPVQSQAQFDVCTDNTPDWQVKITFADGAQITLNTLRSNLISFGGPWQTRIDGQDYIQFSDALSRAFYSLFYQLELIPGQPYATYCHDIDPLSLVYP